jgi:hypothetical protein
MIIEGICKQFNALEGILMFQMAFPNAFGNHGCILQHFEGFFKTPFRLTGHQSYS